MLASFLGTAIAPTLCYLLWMTLAATPQYTSEFRAVVRAPQAATGFDLPQIMGLAAPAQSSQDAYAVIQYLKSQQAVSDLEASAQLRARYASTAIDRWSRLDDHASHAGLTRYWDDKLDAYFENTTGTIVVRVSAFQASDAQQLARASLHLSENLVNEISGRARADLVRYASQDLNAAGEKLRTLERRLLELRNQKGLIDPAAAAAANQQRELDVERNITETRAELRTKGAYLDSNSPIIQLLRSRMRSLEGELGEIEAESTAHGNNDRVLSAAMRQFEELQAEQAFAQKTYQNAAAALTAARSEQVRQQLYLDTIVAPTLPDEASSPRILRNSLLAFALLSGMWLIGFIGIRSIKIRF